MRATNQTRQDYKDYKVKVANAANLIQQNFPTAERINEDRYQSEFEARFQYGACVLMLTTRQRDSWHFSPCGLQIRVSCFLSRLGTKTFPQLKGGSFSWDKIREACAEREKEIEQRQLEEDRKREAACVRDSIRERNGDTLVELESRIPQRFNVVPSDRDLGRFQLTTTLGLDELRRLLDAAGIILDQ